MTICYTYSTVSTTTYTSQCASGAVHLVGGSTSSEGRFEICLGGTWTTLSLYSSSSESQNAAVLCYQLGFTSSGTVQPIEIILIILLRHRNTDLDMLLSLILRVSIMHYGFNTCTCSCLYLIFLNVMFK